MELLVLAEAVVVGGLVFGDGVVSGRCGVWWWCY